MTRIATPLYLPTPAEIAAECADIRAGWDAVTERHRRAVPDERVPARIHGADRNAAVVERETERLFRGNE